MPRIACYFPEQETARVLDSDAYPDDQVWVIGRQRDPSNSKTFIHFKDKFRLISRRHALLRCDEETGLWQIMDGVDGKASSRGTYRREFSNKTRLPSLEWISIRDGDRFFFGSAQYWIFFSYNIDETLQSGQDETPTESRTQVREEGSGDANPWGIVKDIVDWLKAPSQNWKVVALKLLLLSATVAIAIVWITHG